MPKGVYDRSKSAPRGGGSASLADGPAVKRDADPRRRKVKKWSKARRLALAEKMRAKHGRTRITPTLEAAIMIGKAADLALTRIRDGAKPSELELLVLSASRILNR